MYLHIFFIYYYYIYHSFFLVQLGEIGLLKFYIMNSQVMHIVMT
jgi:hypothetical protein